MAYQAEIQIGVKGQRQIQSTQESIKKLRDEIEFLNAVDVFNKKTTNNLQNFNANLKEAAQNLQLAAQGFDEETRAVEQYVRALGEANAAQDRQNKLVKERVRQQNEARAAAIAERTGAKTQYQSPIGPATPDEMKAVYDSLNKLQKRAIDQANDFTEALGRGAQEVRDLQQAQIQGPALPVGFDAERKAAEVKTRLVEDQSIKEINARRKVTRQVLSEQIDADLKAAAARIKNNDAVFKDFMQKDKEYYNDWKSRLSKRTSERKQANKDVSDQQRKLDQQRNRRRDALSSGAIGATFPLLFGQGAGAAVGGGIGGLAGGLAGGQAGFALSLVGTQVGASIDALINGAAALGRALNPLTADIDEIISAVGLAGTETELYIKAIEKNAGKQAALKVATEELAALVGAEGVEALQQFGSATQDLGNSFGQLLTQMRAGVSKAFAGITQEIADSLSDTAALQAGLQRTDGTIGAKAGEFKTLRAKLGKGSSEEQLKNNQRIRQLQQEIITLVQQENTERRRTLRVTQEVQEKLRGIKSQQAQVATQLEILDITEKAKAANTEAADIRKAAVDFVARQEEKVASMRVSLEQQISSIRIQNMSKEAQLRNEQDKLELMRLRNRLNQASQSFAQSIQLDTPGREFAISLNQAAANFNLALAEASNERAANERSNALQLEQLGIRSAQTKANLARQTAQLQAEFEKQSAELNNKVNVYNQQVSLVRFNLEKQIVNLRLNALEQELALERLKLENADSISEKQKRTFESIQEGIETARTAVNNQEAPKPIAGLDLKSPGGVSTQGFDAVIAESKQLIQQLTETKNLFIDEKLIADAQEFSNKILNQTQALIQQQTPLDARLENLRTTAEVSRLVAEGFSKTDATAIVEGQEAYNLFNEELESAKENIEGVIDQFVALEDNSPAVTQAIHNLSIALGMVEGQLDNNKKAANTFVNSFNKVDKIQDHVKTLEAQLNDTQGMIISLATTIEGEISSAMSNAITGLITGTTTVEEAMSNMFANIGKAFIDMATKMIAKALVLKALGALSSAFGGGASTSGPNVDAIGQYMARGGPTKPHGTYIVGEQGPEVLTMGNQSGFIHSNTSEAMDRYRAGGSGGGGGSLDVSYNVTQINGMNFVTEEQFRAGMTRAAKDGAKMGEAGTFKSMKNSRSSRRRVGI